MAKPPLLLAEERQADTRRFVIYLLVEGIILVAMVILASSGRG